MCACVGASVRAGVWSENCSPMPNAKVFSTKDGGTLSYFLSRDIVAFATVQAWPRSVKDFD